MRNSIDGHGEMIEEREHIHVINSSISNYTTANDNIENDYEGRLQRKPGVTGKRITRFREVLFRHGLFGLDSNFGRDIIYSLKQNSFHKAYKNQDKQSNSD